MPNEPSLYIKKRSNNELLIVSIYVDDLICASTNLEMVEEFKKSMIKRFEMTDLGLMKYFLGIQVNQSQYGITLSQEKYATDLLKKFRVLSRFMHDPSKTHYTAAKRVLRYVKGTKNFCLNYSKEEDNSLVGYTDSDWAGSIDDRKSTSGYDISPGSKVITWSSKKKNTVAL
ncbi:uncharacterized protein LOC113316365 [Papaver somniferum]|uniref:uncharacterized protein LOC113316365 n=1 Tax=Papaver somniferum TaxID=3469 RepID=UPI000E6F9FF7|nr:uncharacterized protein LOC113316365 [Papaver somniferum]